MNCRDAYSEGFDRGHEAALYCEVGESDKENACCDCCGTDKECDECRTQAAYSAEDNSRSYSPFEFLAHDLNEDEDRSEMLWDWYDRGVTAGIKAGLKFGRKIKARKA